MTAAIYSIAEVLFEKIKNNPTPDPEDLWKALDSAVLDHKVEWHWVRGHAGNRYNQRVDHLARSAISK